VFEKPSKYYLLDGFPRSIDQVQFMGNGLKEPILVLYLDVPAQIAIDRILQRAKTSGRGED